MRTQMYIYSQVIPFGSIFTGKPYQFPLLWESILVTTVMIPAGVLLYRDDTGRTVAEKLAQRVRLFRTRPALGTFAVMFAHPERVRTSPVRRVVRHHPGQRCGDVGRLPVPLPGGEGVRPTGLLREGGPTRSVHGGIRDGWETGQSGRPDVAAPASGGRCSSR